VRRKIADTSSYIDLFEEALMRRCGFSVLMSDSCPFQASAVFWSRASGRYEFDLCWRKGVQFFFS
jgi:hypothetical protein